MKQVTRISYGTHDIGKGIGRANTISKTPNISRHSKMNEGSALQPTFMNISNGQTEIPQEICDDG